MNLLPDHAPAGPGTCPGYARRFDDWAASYDLSSLQTVLYGPVHDAVLRYAREHVRHPGIILDAGCGTGRLSARLAPDGTLVAAGPSAARPFSPMTRRARRSTPWLSGELPALIAACGLQVERVERIPSVAAIADTVMVVARTTPVRRATRPERRGATAVRPVSSP
jgi:SAM-dependent methyltransferase